MAGGISSLRLPQSRKWRLATLIGALCLTVWIVWRVTDDEPQYQEHGLWHWYELYNSTNKVEKAIGKEAIRNMGTNAVPYLIKVLERGPSQLNSWSRQISYQFIKGELHWQPVHDREDAAIAMMMIGTNAVAAVPALVKSMQQYPYAASSPAIESITLALIGPAALPAVIAALTNSNKNISGNATYGLKYFLWHSDKREECFQLMLDSLWSHPDQKTRESILHTLKYDSYPDYGKAILLEQFKTRDTNTFPMVLEILTAWHGTNSQAIAEDLAELRNQVNLEKQALVDDTSRQFLSQKNTNTPPRVP